MRIYEAAKKFAAAHATRWSFKERGATELEQFAQDRTQEYWQDLITEVEAMRALIEEAAKLVDKREVGWHAKHVGMKAEGRL